MKKETFTNAVALQQKISQLEYDIKLLKEELLSENKLIRFGGQFNVSSPIECNAAHLTTFILAEIESKAEIILELRLKFNDL
jgi:hypothetical protein